MYCKESNPLVSGLLNFCSKRKVLRTWVIKVSIFFLNCVVLSHLQGPEVYPQDEEEFFIEKEITANRKKTVLVYFVGGVTIAEIAALRFLNQRANANVKFVVATTEIITGDRAVNQMRP
jgi:hypothetical protein